MDFKFDINPPAKEEQSRFYVVGEGEHYSHRAINIWKMFNYEVKYDFGELISFKENGYEVSRDIFEMKKPPGVYVIVKEGKPVVRTHAADYNHEILPEAEAAIVEYFYDKFGWKFPSKQK